LSLRSGWKLDKKEEEDINTSKTIQWSCSTNHEKHNWRFSK